MIVNSKLKLLRITTVSKSLYFLLKGQLQFLNQHFDVIGVANGDEMLQKVAQREGIQSVGIKMKREISVFSDLISLIRLAILFNKEKPFIVHSNTPKASLLSMIAGWMVRVPNRIYTVTGLRFETTSGILKTVLINMERITCYFATKVIPEGEGVKNMLIQQKITHKPLEVIHNGNINGIDLNFYGKSNVVEASKDLRKRLGIHENCFVFIFIGRLVKDKGITELTIAFERLFKKNDNIRLLLVGPLEEELDPLPLIISKKIQEHSGIVYAGRQDDIRPFLSISNVFVFPSYREGFPNVVLQAGAFELPCIVTNINGSNEIIISGKNGLIVPVKNDIKLEESMETIMSNKELYELLKLNSRKMIETRYQQSKVWDALLEMYKSL